MKPALIEALEKLVTWAQGDLLPLWLSRGLVGLSRGSTSEQWAAAQFDRRGEPDLDGPIELASQAQLAYVLARAEQLGWSVGNRARVRKLMEFSARHGTLPCRSDGYVHRLDAQFAILDEHHYVSDHALFILASAAISAAYGDSSDIRRAYNILDWLELRLASPHGGWFEHSGIPAERSARSHFTLLLAFLYAYEVTQKPRWLEAAEALVGLYQQKLLDGASLRVSRTYGEAWAAVDPQIWCPEDQFLWIYGIHKFARCSGRKLSALEQYHRLQTGVADADGLYRAVQGVGDSPKQTGALAAAILAGVSLAAEGDTLAAAALEAQIGVFFHQCKTEGPRGLFVDRVGVDGVPETYTSAETTLILFDAARDAARLLKSAGARG